VILVFEFLLKPKEASKAFEQQNDMLREKGTFQNISQNTGELKRDAEGCQGIDNACLHSPTQPMKVKTWRVIWR
jgi:hypothetical protein